MSFWLIAALASIANASERSQVASNQVFEATLTSRAGYADPFNEIEVDVVFETPGGKQIRIPAFWAGAQTWKFRYSSAELGVHRYRTACSNVSDNELHDRTGEVEIVPYAGKNDLYLHGPIKIGDDRRHFEHADGTPFFWLADTWWMGLSKRLGWPTDFRELAANRKERGFNVIQIVAGLYPDMPAFDERGANEAGFPWEQDYRRIRPEYFDEADQRLNYLVDQGFVPCIVGAWGFHLPWLGEERMKKHWRYLIARYGALPVVWCIAGEVNLPYYLEPGFPHGGEEQTKRWIDVLRAAHEENGLDRLVTIHPTGLPPLSGRGLIGDDSLIDFDMLQTGHGQRQVLPPTLDALRSSYAATPLMPVINSEVCYEALLDQIPAEIPRLMFWTCMMSGAAGHSYGANGIWQVNQSDRPYGASPHGGNYGTLPWNKAMNLPGAKQIGFGKALLQSKEWWKFEPHPEWVRWKEDDRITGQWIWYPEGNPAADAPIENRFFRKTFELPENQTLRSASVRATADDHCEVFLNGRRVGSHSGWNSLGRFDILKDLKPGKNVIAIVASNRDAPVAKNPAGLLCDLRLEFSDGNVETIGSDDSWSVSKASQPGWDLADFTESFPQKAQVVAPYGDGPWGHHSPSVERPLACGIRGGVRVVYVLDPRPIVLQELEPGENYKVEYFDPVTGNTVALPPLKAEEDGTAEVANQSKDHDWVLLLEPQQ